MILNETEGFFALNVLPGVLNFPLALIFLIGGSLATIGILNQKTKDFRSSLKLTSYVFVVTMATIALFDQPAIYLALRGLGAGIEGLTNV